jgi:hypothetical protein
LAPLFRAQIRFGDGPPELISGDVPAPNVLAMGVRYEWLFMGGKDCVFTQSGVVFENADFKRSSLKELAIKELSES